jgi:hypothetical protein
MRHILLLFLLTSASALPASAQLRLAAPVETAVPLIRLSPSLGASAIQTGLQPASELAAPRLCALAAPALSLPAIAPTLQPQDLAAPMVAAPQLPQALPPVFDEKSLAAALKPETPPADRAAALSLVFDGVAAAPAMPSLPGGAVEMINGAYGLYSWLGRQPELAGSPQALANVLLAALPALQKGPLIAMKDAAGLTLLCANDASAAPIVVPLAGDVLSKPSSPQAGLLARRLEQAKALDRSEGGVHMRVAELMAQLPAIAIEAPEQPQAESKTPSEPLPDAVRQPRAYMERLMRDAMRQEDPFAALKMLAHARQEAHRRLNYQDASRFLESLLGGGQLLARQFIPGLLEQAQQAAGGHDRAKADRLLEAALDFCEYGPSWKQKVVKAYEEAQNTLEVLDRYGPIDESTGLPVPTAR